MTRDDLLALQAKCTHKHVICRPVGGNANGWTAVWVCEQCTLEFVPKIRMAEAWDEGCWYASPLNDEARAILLAANPHRSKP